MRVAGLKFGRAGGGKPRPFVDGGTPTPTPSPSYQLLAGLRATLAGNPVRMS